MRLLCSKVALAGFAAGLGLAAGLALGQAGGRDAAARGADEAARIKAEYAPVLALTGTAKREVLAIAKVLQRQPGMAIDFSAAAGQYCLNPGAGSMVHFATDPDRDPVDILYVHDPAPLVASGLDPKRLPPQPGSVAGLRPGVWYYNDGTRPDPLHGNRVGATFLVMGVDVR
jgi:hypothetical protein